MDILDELGERNEDWKRKGCWHKLLGWGQYSQLISLMDNWDSFKENVNIAETWFLRTKYLHEKSQKLQGRYLRWAY